MILGSVMQTEDRIRKGERVGREGRERGFVRRISSLLVSFPTKRKNGEAGVSHFTPNQLRVVFEEY